MIRLRFGQTWRRDAGAPVDSVALSIHGMNLLVGANEEPLADVAEAWSAAWEVLTHPEGELAELTLPESRLHLVMRRLAPQSVVLQVAHLGSPARLTHAAVPVDLADLLRAWMAGVSALERELQKESRADIARRVLTALEHVRQINPFLPANAPRGPGYGYRCFARDDLAFGFELWDPDERLLSLHSEGKAPLGALLVPGRVTFQLPGQAVEYSPDSIFLFALELARRAHARLDSRQTPNEALLDALDPPLAAVFQFGLDLAFAIELRNSAHRDNPYLRELVERCQKGLRMLRSSSPSLSSESNPAAAKGGSRATPVSTRVLTREGRLRRLKFVPRYQIRLNPPDAAVRLIPVARGGLWISSSRWAERYNGKGERLFRLESEQGVAVSPTDWAQVAEHSRHLGYFGKRKGATWFQPHDGLPLGPGLHAHGDMLFTQSETRTAVAFWAATGREAWRFSPFRSSRIHVGVIGRRAVIATDAGDMFGLSMVDGQLLYRFEAPLPFTADPIALGQAFVALLSAGERGGLVCADAESGKLLWTRDLPWSCISAPVVAGERVWIAGQADAGSRVLSLLPSGKPDVQASLPFTDSEYFVLPLKDSVLVTGSQGAAARFSREGKLEYAVEQAGESAWRGLPPRLARGVVFLPGDPLRALDAKSGRVLAELRGGPALTALETDNQAGVYTLDESGKLTAFRLISHFAVVD